MISYFLYVRWDVELIRKMTQCKSINASQLNAKSINASQLNAKSINAKSINASRLNASRLNAKSINRKKSLPTSFNVFQENFLPAAGVRQAAVIGSQQRSLLGLQQIQRMGAKYVSRQYFYTFLGIQSQDGSGITQPTRVTKIRKESLKTTEGF
jgi:hypothetical protein